MPEHNIATVRTIPYGRILSAHTELQKIYDENKLYKWDTFTEIM